MANKKTLYLHGFHYQPHRLDFWLKRNQKATKPQYRIVLQEVQKDSAGRIVVVALLIVRLDKDLRVAKMRRYPLLDLPLGAADALSAMPDESPSSPKTPD